MSRQYGGRMTTTMMEKSIKQQREQEDNRKHIQIFSSENAKLASAANFQSKLEARRQYTTEEKEKHDREIREKEQFLQREKQIHDKNEQEKQAIISQMEKHYLEQERQRIEIQRICDDSPELKELERSLKLAYLNKDRSIQQQERLLQAAKENERNLAMEQEMEKHRLGVLVSDKEKFEHQKARMAEERQLLQRQIDDRRIQAQASIKLVQEDREMVNAIVEKINQEDEAEYRRKKEMQVATAQMIKDFEIQRKIELEAAHIREREEEEKIKRYNDSIESRKGEAEAIRHAKREEEDRILRQIVAETEKRRLDEEEFNNLRDMLWEEELEQKRAEDAAARKKKQDDSKKQMLEMNSRLLVLRQQKMTADRQEEIRLIEKMRLKFDEDERREAMEELAKLVAKQRHLEQLQRQLREKASLSVQEQERERLAQEDHKQQDEYRRRVVAEARRRLLSEHADELKGYIPGKVLHGTNNHS